MAISKILHMKDSGKSYHGKHLKRSIDYITDASKTQDGKLVGVINCLPDRIFEQMRATKNLFGKNEGRQGYHIVLSFKQGEADPDTAFEIAGKFALRYVGARYETVYSVHDNTDCVHAHVVWNSVSFVDGKKFHYKKGDWERDILPITNELCREYGLSVLEVDGERANDERDEWNQRHTGNTTWNSMIKRDLDACILQASTFAEFQNLLTEKGYVCKEGKHFAVKPPGMGRYRRCKTLGEDYTESRIRERIKIENLSTYKVESFEEAERIVYSQIPRGKRAKLTGLQKKYYSKLYRLGLLKRRPYSQAWKYKDDIRKMHKIQEQYLFLVNHDIESVEELQNKSQMLMQEKKACSNEKSKMYRAKKKCEELFEIRDSMETLYEREQAYQNGDEFFQEEHELWTKYEEQLKAQGYSYEEVIKLQEHYNGEIARLRKLELEVRKELRVVESLVKELDEVEREMEIKKEQEKKEVRTQPTR